MPAILERLVSQLMQKGKSKSSAFAIATSSLQRAGDLKPGTNKATPKGNARGKMSPGARAKDRASKQSGKPASSFNYNSKTNVATQKPGYKKKR